MSDLGLQVTTFMADDLLIKTKHHILSQQYDRNDIKTLCKIQFLDMCRRR